MARELAALQHRVGVAVGLSTVAALVAYPLLLIDPDAVARLDPTPYWSVVASGGVIGIVISSRTVQRRLSRRGYRVTSRLSVIILLLTVVGGTLFSGGSNSELHYLLALPLAWSALVHPLRTLLWLTGLAAGLVAASSVATASPVLPAQTAVRAATIAGVVVTTAWLTRAHERQLDEAHAARRDADQYARNLATLATSATQANDLDESAALEAVTASVVQIGYDGGAFLVPHSGAPLWTETTGSLAGRQVDLDERSLQRCLDGEVVELHRKTTTRMVPIQVRDRVVGILVGAGDPSADVDGRSLRILGRVTSTVLANAEHHRSNHEQVQRLRSFESMRHDLLSTASHELRTPATIIKGASELLSMRWDDLTEAQRRDFTGRIHKHVTTLDRVLDQLAQFVEMSQGGQQRVRRRDAPLREVVDRALTVMGDELARHPVEVEVEDDLSAPVEPDMLVRALGELLHNAATHTPAGTPVSVRARHDGADAVVIEVSDRGPGVGASDLPGLTAPFARAGEMLTRASRGRGHGRTLAPHPAQAHGGSLEVTNSGGLTATIRIPVEDEITVLDLTDPHPAKDAATVLVVEDDDNVRTLVAMVLRDAGCRVLEAADGRNALAIAATRTPDLIVLDVGLPGLDGREVARLLREDEATRDIPIVVCTGSAEPRQLWTIWANGADALLTKPYDLEELTDTVLRLAMGGRAHHAPRTGHGQRPGRTIDRGTSSA